MVARSVLITGGLGDIGLAVARCFAAEGANIFIVDRRADDGHAAEILQAAGAARVATLAIDVGREAEVNAAVDHMLAQFGALDVLVNVAGVMIYKPLTDLRGDDWSGTLAVNLIGAALMIGRSFCEMKPGSAIINVASVHARRTSADVAPYAAAKAGLVSLTRSAAIEGKQLGIRVNAISPGAIDTTMLASSPNIASGKEVIDPGDIGRPEDIANLAYFLASSGASFLSGEEIVADGGRMGRL